MPFFGGGFDAPHTPLMSQEDEGSVEKSKEADPSLLNIENVTEMANHYGDDMGLGLTVLDEQPSHEQDLAHVNGHIVLAILRGNQCTVLFDMMPTDNEFLHGV